RGLAMPAYTMTPVDTPFYNSDRFDDHTAFDPERAMRLLDGTPYEGGKNWPAITMSMRNVEADAHKAAMAAIIEMLGKHLGMAIEPEIGDPQVIYRDMWNGKKQLMWLRWFMDYPDANH